jgi:hypothetical protein
MDSGDIKKLFGDLHLQMLLERKADPGQMQGEIWRLFLFLMLLLLLAEGLLILPAKRPRKANEAATMKPAAQPKEQMV